MSGFEAELFKVRDEDNTVIGVASRMKHAGSGGNFVQWVIHLPARGTLFAALEPTPAAGQARSGALRAGTGEFESRRGSVREAFLREVDADDPDSEGRIELQVALVGLQEEAQ